MNVRKTVLIFGICVVFGICALVAICIYFLKDKENKENSKRTEKARAARWATDDKEGATNESISENENQILTNETLQSN